MADKIVSWGGYESKGTSGMSVTGSLGIINTSTSSSVLLDINGSTNNSFTFIANPVLNAGERGLKVNVSTAGYSNNGNSIPYDFKVGGTSYFTIANYGLATFARSVQTPNLLIQGNPSNTTSLRVYSQGVAGNAIETPGSEGTVHLGSNTVNTKVNEILRITGKGTTSSTTALLVQNANASSSFEVKDDGVVEAGTTSRKLTISGSISKFGDTFIINQTGGDRLLELTNFTIQDSSVYALRLKAGTGANLYFGAPGGTINLGQGVTSANIYFKMNQSSPEFPNIYLNQLVSNKYVNHLQSYTAISTGDDSYGGNTTPKGHPIYIFAGRNTTSGVFGDVILQATPQSGSKGNVGIGTTTPAFRLDVSGSGRFTDELVSSRLTSLQNVNNYISLAGGGGVFIDFRANDTAIARMSGGGMFIGSDTSPSARLHIKGSGTTSSTTSLLVQNANASSSLQVKDSGQVYFPFGDISYGSPSGPPIKLNITQPTSTVTYAGVSIGHLNSAGTAAVTVVGGRNTFNDYDHVIFGSLNNISASSNRAFIFGNGNNQNTHNGVHIIIGSGNTSNAYTNGQNASIIIGQSNSTNGYYGGGLIGSSIKYYANRQLAFGGNSNNVNFAISEVYFGNGVRNENYSVNSNYGHGPNISINTSQAYSGSEALNRNGGNITLRGGQGTGTGSAGDVIFTTATTGSDGATYHSYSDRVWIKGHTGNVGIGTSTPTANLHIVGDSILNSNSTLLVQNSSAQNILDIRDSKWVRITGQVDLLSQTGAGHCMARINDNGTIFRNQTFNIDNATGNAGQQANLAVGRTASTAARLHVLGSGTTSSTTSLLVQNSSNVSSLTIKDDNYGEFRFPTVSSTPVDGFQFVNSASNRYVRIGGADLDLETTGNLKTSKQIIAPNFNVTNGVITGFNNTTIDTATDINIKSRANAASLIKLLSGGNNAIPTTATTGTVYVSYNLNASVTPDTSAILQVDSVVSGFLPPRMTTAQKNAIASPAAGLMVYDTSLNQMSYYNGSTWVNF